MQRAAYERSGRGSPNSYTWSHLSSVSKILVGAHQGLERCYSALLHGPKREREKVTKAEQRGASEAVYNTLAGFSTFFGSVLGGYLVIFFDSLGLDFGASLRATYIISATGRLGTGLLFLKIEEPHVYPSTVREELARMMTEDAERTRNMVSRAEQLGEKADSDFRADMDRFGNRSENNEKTSKENSSKNAK